MSTKINLWKVENNKLKRLETNSLDYEERLEDWIENDIRVISEQLLIIGRQVNNIDLLALDDQGNLVILELKRDKTPRDVVAQVLDYASWVKDLDYDQVQEIFNSHFSESNLEQAYKDKFGIDIPETINLDHKMIIVASSLDSQTERIVKYLSETYDMNINVVNFTYTRIGEEEFIARTTLLNEEEVTKRAVSRSKRKPPLSWEELEQFAEKRGVLNLYRKAMENFDRIFDSKTKTRSNVAFIGFTGEKKSRDVMISIYPNESRADKGLAVNILADRLTKYFNCTQDDIYKILGEPSKNLDTWDPERSWFIDENILDRLIILFSKNKEKSRNSLA